MMAEGGGGGGTGGAKLVMGMPYFLDEHGAVIVGFKFGIKGNTEIDETVNDLDGVEGEGGKGFTETPSKILPETFFFPISFCPKKKGSPR